MFVFPAEMAIRRPLPFAFCCFYTSSVVFGVNWKIIFHFSDGSIY